MTDPNTPNEDEQVPLFGGGAEWVRADFHLHTIKEPGASRKAYRAEYKDKEGEFVGDFVEQLKKEDIRVGVITNHNHFDIGEFRALAKRARKEEILLLPGIELGVCGGGSSIHTLVVFDPIGLNAENNFIDTFLRGQFPTGRPSEGDATVDTIAGCLGKLEGLGVEYFVIFAHVESDNGLLKGANKTELKPQYQQSALIWNNRVLGFQACKSDDQWVREKLPSGMPIPARVHGSDPSSSISEVGRRERGESYLKVSELSFSSVQFALKDHVLRVREASQGISSRPMIETVEITGGKLEFAATRFSPELNTLIGSRGSGKSLTIESLRWCLNRAAGKGDTGYKQDLLDVFLQRGATVKVTGINAHGSKVEVSRSYTQKTNPAKPIVRVDGVETAVSVDNVFPGLLYFGQKDLDQREDGFTEDLFDQILGRHPESLDTDERIAKAAFEKAIDTYLVAVDAKSKDDEYKYEQKNLQQEMLTFKEQGVDEKLGKITAFDQDQRRLSEFIDTLRERLEQSKGTVKNWGEANQISALIQAEDNKHLLETMLKLEGDYNSSQKSITDGIAGIEKVLGELEKVAKGLEEKRKALQDTFAKILQELKIPGLDSDLYREKKNRLEQLNEIRGKADGKGAKIEDLEKALLKAGDSWIGSKKAISDHYQSKADKVNQSLPASLKIAIEFQGDRQGFKEHLKSVLGGTGFTDNSYSRLEGACPNGIELLRRRNQILSTELSNRMGEIFEETMETRFKDLIAFCPADRKLVLFEDSSIRELSQGKRAMALLTLLLSLDKHPIVILDQPEDDLDNETIHRLVVAPLAEKKEKTQFIIATHNPNIPVLGDAEQVVACFERDGGAFEQETGSLDRKSTKESIIRIMEGGKDAFDKRHDIYTLWKK